MNATCTQCANPVPADGDLCGVCWDQIPAVFECHDCGNTCYKKDSEFGGWELTEDGQGQVPICSECLEEENSGVIAADQIDEYHQATGIDWSEGYFEEML